MTFYAYTPSADGSEPCGSSGKILRHDLKSQRYFIRFARRILGDSCRCFRIADDRFYRESSHHLIYRGS